MSTIEKAVDKQSKLDAEQASSIASTESGDMPTAQDATTIERKAARADAAAKASTQKDYLSKATVQLDLERLELMNFVSLTPERRVINEEFRVIKRKLLNNAFGGLSHTLKHPNLIMVSSSRPGEGKTFNAINLALSMALEKDKTVLLVDADVLRPMVSKTLDFSVENGLTDYLSSDDLDVEDVLLSTNVDRLKLIAAGRPHHLSTELLASEKMLKLATEFATRYPDRVVIFDAPPLLGVNETAVLAAMCGQAVVVVEENESKLAEIDQAVALLPEDLAVGFVINKAHRNQGKGYGYYYSGTN
ncbi:XrtA-associated tyrosine autokinase [Alkalimonas collagenimarina]|uniref:non-specific protein-tyrosine kinase n=1 Tax=Alkalimonas collagenimarina TaxID=400390 RepID=A0ABT9GZA5_9GAMM|nr:XrtA-associated tyrosine autokinase [Alkalimonas collagenimarina]MDP4536387.1 XrtA-associated tyrosine autokinase [Alkalimonas collagenimarina]